MKNRPLLSIIIPTKERYETLFESVESMVKHITSNKIEFVIHDNTYDNKKALDFLNKINDKRIVYKHYKKNIDVVTNFNMSFSLANGEYVLFIGDDDFINPYIMEVIESIFAKNKIACMIYPRANYYWSNVAFDYEFDFFEKSSLQVKKKYTLQLKKMYTHEEFEFLLDKGGIYLFDMPQAYHAIVKHSVLASIASKYGNIFLSASPDMSIAVSLACVLKDYHHIDFPISIAGASYNSAAGMGRRKAHSATLDELPEWLPESMKDNWNNNIPKIWNGFTVYAHSILQVSNLCNKRVSLNYLYLYRKIIEDNIFDIQYVYVTLKSINASVKDKIVVITTGILAYYIKATFFILPKFMKNYFIYKRKGFKDTEHINQLNSVDSCMLYLKKKFQRTVNDS